MKTGIVWFVIGILQGAVLLDYYRDKQLLRTKRK